MTRRRAAAAGPASAYWVNWAARARQGREGAPEAPPGCLRTNIPPVSFSRAVHPVGAAATCGSSRLSPREALALKTCDLLNFSFLVAFCLFDGDQHHWVVFVVGAGGRFGSSLCIRAGSCCPVSPSARPPEKAATRANALLMGINAPNSIHLKKNVLHPSRIHPMAELRI